MRKVSLLIWEPLVLGETIEETQKELEKRIDEAVSEAISEFGLPTRVDIKRIEKAMEELERKIEQHGGDG